MTRKGVYIPKEIPFKADKVIIIVPYGAFLLLIPVPEKVIEIDVKDSIQERQRWNTIKPLKRRAEEKVKEETALKLKSCEQD